MQIPMIDTLCAIVDIEGYGNTDKMIKLINSLEEKKQEAKEKANQNLSQKVLVTIGDQTFQILQNGAKGYAYLLHNDAYEVRLAQYRSKNEDFFPIFIKVKSEYLWSQGVENTWLIITKWISENIGEVKANKINRIDLCCHTDDLELTADDAGTFQGHFHEDVMFRYRRKVNAMCFGSRSSQKIYCRIYNKTLEVNKTKKKLWFNEIWQKAGLDIGKVWNVEFEVNREFLKDVKVESVEDALSQLKPLWEFCTGYWIVKKNMDASRIERCTTNEKWITIHDAYDSYEGIGLVRRQKQLETSAFAMLPGTLGNITSFAARAEVIDLDILFKMLRSQGQKYLSKRDTSLEDIIAEKMSLLSGEGELN